jgi:chromosome segregation ATPase
MCDKITTFMGCGEAVADGKVTTALAHSFVKLSIQEFIEVSGFKIDTIMLNYFWQVMTKRQWVHMHPLVLEFLGYEGSIIDQRKNFTRYLKRQEYKFEELSSKDDRCKEYDDIVREQAMMKPAHLANRKWLIMDSRDFKRAIMGLRTKRADAIKDYYFNLEELLQLYVDYDKRFEVRKREEDAKREISSRDAEIAKRGDKIDSLEEMMREMKQTLDEMNKKNDQLLDDNVNAAIERNTLIAQNNDLQQDVTTIGRRLGAACVDRAPRPLNPIKRERFLFIRWTNLNYHRTIPNPTLADNHRVYRYYAIRGQTQYSVSALRTQRQKDPALEVILELDVQPNTKTLYNRVKEELEERGVRYVGNALSIANSDVDEAQLVERLSEINDDKYNV